MLIQGRTSNHKPSFYYKGAIHIHSRYSDGSGNYKQIVRAGLRANLDFLVITDHNTLKLKNKGKEGWYNNRLFVLVGEEVSHSNQHLLALGITKEIPKNLRPTQSSSAIQRDGGVCIIAHPDGTYQFDFRKRDYSWKHWDVDSYDGIEIWSYMFDWIKHIKPWNLPYYFFFRNKAISGPLSKTLARWDRLNKERKVVGIGAIDAHARGIRPFQIFPYDQIFQTIVTYIGTTNPLSAYDDVAKKQLLTNLKNGHCFFAYEKHATAKGFQFFIETPDNRLEMGSRARFEQETRLYVILPKRSVFTIIQDGRIIHKGAGTSWNMKINEPGVYRIETSLNNQPWIFSNPIVLTDD